MHSVPINRSKISTRISTASKCLENAWRMIMKINQRNVKLPLVVIMVLSAGDRTRKYGHLGHNTWEYRGKQRRSEVGINSLLFKTPESLLATMLHEAAHAALSDNHNAGMGSSRYYHTKKFRDTCFKLGLHCEFKDTRYGWTITSWPNDRIPKQYAPVVQYLKQNLPMGTSGSWFKPKGKTLPKSGHIRLECSCKIHAENSILITKTMLKRITRKGGIRCEICKTLFVQAETKAPNVPKD
jgi:hypothetical protein